MKKHVNNAPWEDKILKAKHILEGDRRMIFMIMGSVHVGKSNWHVARYWLKRFKAQPKHIRFEIAKEALACHRSNQDEYHSVMTGKYYVDPE